MTIYMSAAILSSLCVMTWLERPKKLFPGMILTVIAIHMVFNSILALLADFSYASISYASWTVFLFYNGTVMAYAIGGAAMGFRNDVARRIVLLVTMIEIIRLGYIHLSYASSAPETKANMPDDFWLTAGVTYIMHGLVIWLLTRPAIRLLCQNPSQAPSR